ncbi:thermonuclease family protein [Georgenia yuyongxinii]|uniref:Thermonuclease family protein n=1 Tax=Georgenia yuyongxinii TaxID=2589797 RepID=A0A552WUM1_9MICO|nr:thermonuclease family protein [Georgenia yuyongxinii]TRW46406.1 thermonuclease family protein [Georgenia yuyongxinii]
MVGILARHKILVAVIAVVLLATAGIATARAVGPLMATVTGVVDGDTIDVTYRGKDSRVRLLNVDTPETVDPDEPMQCLGPEATAFLEGMLPPGTRVELQHDKERHDQYGRELAGVFLDDTLVNAQIAREGLGIAVVYPPNDRFYDEVLAAQNEAEATGHGLYSTEIDCTIPAQVAAFEETAEQAETFVALSEDASIGRLDRYGAKTAAAIAAGHTLLGVLNGDDDRRPLLAYTAGYLTGKTRDVSRAVERLTANAQTLEDRRVAEVRRVEELLERQRVEREERAAREAARQVEEARQRAEEEARRQAEAEAARQRSVARAPSSASSSGSSSSGRTSTSAPCRRYAPGGKTWTPMPC